MKLVEKGGKHRSRRNGVLQETPMNRGRVTLSEMRGITMSKIRKPETFENILVAP